VLRVLCGTFARHAWVFSALGAMKMTMGPEPDSPEVPRTRFDAGFFVRIAGWGALGTMFLRMFVSPFLPHVDLWVAGFFCDTEVRTATQVSNPRPGETVWNHTIKCMYSDSAGVDITFFVFPTATLVSAIPVVFALAVLCSRRVFPRAAA
jgi:hypothetical protein